MHLLLILLAVIVILTTAGHARVCIKQMHKTSVDIVQTKLSCMHPRMLIEWSPILISDKVVDPMQLVYTVFSCMFVFKKGPHPCSKIEKSNIARFTLLHNSAETNKAVVHLKMNSISMSVVLGTKQVLVLPPTWAYVCANESITETNLYDPFALIYYLVSLRFQSRTDPALHFNVGRKYKGL
jgi:hypothetical protein